MSHSDQFSRCQWSLIIIVLVVWFSSLSFFTLISCIWCNVHTLQMHLHFNFKISHLFSFRHVWLCVFYFKFFFVRLHGLFICLTYSLYPIDVHCAFHFECETSILISFSSLFQMNRASLQTKTVCGCIQTVLIPRCPCIKMNISFSSNICLMMETLHLIFK